MKNMETILTAQVATCPFCKKADAVLLQENDHIFVCSCGASFVKWWAEETKIKVETKKIDLTGHIERLQERCENIFSPVEDDRRALEAISERMTVEKEQAVAEEAVMEEEKVPEPVVAKTIDTAEIKLKVTGEK